MYQVLASVHSNQRRNAWAMNSGPLSLRKWPATPRATNNSASIQDVLGGEASRHHQGQTFARVLVHDRQPLQRPSTRRTVEDEIPGPHVVGMLGPTSRTGVGTVAHMSLFPGFLRHFQPLPPPQP